MLERFKRGGSARDDARGAVATDERQREPSPELSRFYMRAGHKVATDERRRQASRAGRELEHERAPASTPPPAAATQVEDERRFTKDRDGDRGGPDGRPERDERRFTTDRDVDRAERGRRFEHQRTGAATETRDPDRDGADDRAARPAVAPVVAAETMRTIRALQRDHFGGTKWGSAFFGWLSAVGLASLLLGIAAAAGVALGLADEDTETIGIGGGIALLCVLALAWFCGGYVAGRMARFDGGRQGIGVWGWTLIAGAIVALLAIIGGNEYDVFAELNLPRLPVGDETLSTEGALALGAALLTTLVFAVLGGAAGERYHRRVDRVAHREVVVER